MARLSPLFHSSLELFAHAIEHYNLGAEKDRKFVILHLANSIELIFKDLLLDLGKTIYKGPKETISIQGAIRTLKTECETPIPNLNKLELLIDERNALQHRYGFPNELTIIYYMDSTYEFFKEFLHNYYNDDVDLVLAEFLSEEDLANFQLRNNTDIHELDKLLKLSSVHPVGALLSGYTYIEKYLHDIKEIILEKAREEDNQEFYTQGREFSHHLFRMTNSNNILRMFDLYGIDITDAVRKEFMELRSVRNKVAHGREEPSKDFVISMIKMVKKIDPKLSKLRIAVEKDPMLVFKDRD